MTLYNESSHNSSPRCYCLKYKSRGKVGCSPHHISLDSLTDVVVRAIQEVQHYSEADEKAFGDYLAKKLALKEKKEIRTLDKKISDSEYRLTEISNILKKLYEDKIIGKMEEELFTQLSSNFLKEQKDLNQDLNSAREALFQHKSKQQDFNNFTDTLKQYTNITRENLTPKVLNLLIARIEIGQRDKPRARNFHQDVDIYFRGIGMLEETEKVNESIVDT